MLLNLADAPRDPIERIIWLSGVQTQVRRELDQELGEAYFNARLQRRLDEAVTAGPYGRKRVIAMTRSVNASKGQSVRWGDGES